MKHHQSIKSSIWPADGQPITAPVGRLGPTAVQRMLQRVFAADPVGAAAFVCGFRGREAFITAAESAGWPCKHTQTKPTPGATP